MRQRRALDIELVKELPDGTSLCVILDALDLPDRESDFNQHQECT
jgi:hypothetical protein